MKRNTLCFAILFTMSFINLAWADSTEITKNQALEIAGKTKEVQSFLKYYGDCEGCNPSYSIGKTSLIGCAEYRIDDNSIKDEWTIAYWVSDACSFRYPDKPSLTRILISINKKTGQISSREPELKYIEDRTYCKNDNDCLCLSGSGVPFIGCVNTFHGPTSFAGSYQCDKCKCINNVCKKDE